MFNRRVLKIWAAAFMVSTMLSPIPAQAEPITVALFGSAFAASFGGAIVSSIIGAGISWAAAQFINLIFPPITSAESTSNTAPNPQEVQYGERVARSGFFGIQPIGGHWVHANEYSNSTKLQLVYILADGWIENLSQVQVDGKIYDLISQTVSGTEHYRYYVDTYDALIDIRIHDGRPGQTADTELVAQTTGWDSTKKYSNMAYAAVTVTSNRDKFNSIPEFIWIAQGLRCYDIRLDSSVGGSGTHRFDDPTTWEYTVNPAVQAYHYLRGYYFNGIRVLGAGYTAAALDTATFIAAMNVCDESVSVPVGDGEDAITRARYECHTQFNDTETYGSVLDRLCAAMGGFYAERQGRISIFAGKAQSSVLTITDDDLAMDTDVEFDVKRAGESLISAIQGTYTHSTDFSPTPYTAISPSEFVYSGMEPRTQEANFPQVQDAHQAYLLAKALLYQNQLQATGVITLDIKDILIEVNDWITWESDFTHIGTRTYRVMSVLYNFKAMTVSLTLQEISSDVFSDDSVAADLVEPDRPLPVFAYIDSVNITSVYPTSLTGSNGTSLPALSIDYDAIIDPAVSGIKFEYRIVGTTDTIKDYDTIVSDGSMLTTKGLTPGGLYEVRAILDTLPGRTVDWSDWVEASGTVAEVSASVADSSVTIAKLSTEMQAIVGALSGSGPGTLASTINAINDEIARLAASAATASATEKRNVELLTVQVGTAIAAVLTEQAVRASEDEALATALIDVATEIETNITAGGLIQFNSAVSGSGETAEASIAIKVRATVADAFANAGIFLKAEADGEGGTSANVLIAAEDNETGSHILVGSSAFRIFAKFTA